LLSSVTNSDHPRRPSMAIRRSRFEPQPMSNSIYTRSSRCRLISVGTPVQDAFLASCKARADTLVAL
jgi:hypothetical protein